MNEHTGHKAFRCPLTYVTCYVTLKNLRIYLKLLCISLLRDGY